MSQQHLSHASAEVASLAFAPAAVQRTYNVGDVLYACVSNKNLMLALRITAIAAIWAGLFFAGLNSPIPYH